MRMFDTTDDNGTTVQPCASHVLLVGLPLLISYLYIISILVFGRPQCGTRCSDARVLLRVLHMCETARHAAPAQHTIAAAVSAASDNELCDSHELLVPGA